uniref:Uncharacterized protein n=1 Tax=Panagrolaimus sp. JU765 TaxID=591449 RepID=A0AC34QPD4_9BILA
MQCSLINQLSKVVTFTIFVFAVLYQKSLALTCYDNTGKDNEMRLVSNDDWTFCSLIPDAPFNKNTPGKVYGLGAANDDLAPYLLAFENNDANYAVLSVCIFERYDLRTFSPKFQVPENLFRCVCNYDKCNSRTSFEHYLDRLADKSAKKQSKNWKSLPFCLDDCSYCCSCLSFLKHISKRQDFSYVWLFTGKSGILAPRSSLI